MEETRYTLDFRGVTQYLELHAVLIESLDLPEHYRVSWPSFVECMCEIHGDACRIEIFGYDVIEGLFEASAKKLLASLREWKVCGAGRGQEHRVFIVRDDESIELDTFPTEEETGRYTLDFRSVKHFLETHLIIRDTLDFPDYYGCNWDAFWDCMTEPFGHSLTIEVFGIDVLEKFGNDAKQLLKCLKNRKHFGVDSDEDIRIEIVQGDERIEIDDYPIEE